MRTNAVAEICGVTKECIRQNAKKVGIVLENGKIHKYTEDELKKIQIQLMKNAQNNNVNASDQVRNASKTVLEVGLVAKVCLDSPEAWEQFKRLGDTLVEQRREAKELEIKNQQLQIEVDKYAQWMSASQIKKEYNLPSRPEIATVALELGLKRGEDWIEKQYDTDYMYTKKLYSPKAVDLIIDYFYGD